MDVTRCYGYADMLRVDVTLILTRRLFVVERYAKDQVTWHGAMLFVALRVSRAAGEARAYAKRTLVGVGDAADAAARGEIRRRFIRDTGGFIGRSIRWLPGRDATVADGRVDEDGGMFYAPLRCRAVTARYRCRHADYVGVVGCRAAICCYTLTRAIGFSFASI